MARQFVRDNTDNDCVTGVHPVGLADFGYGTLAAVYYPTTIAGGTSQVIIVGDGAGGLPAALFILSSGRVGYGTNAGSANLATPVLTTNKWWLIAVTKDTGTVLPRVHIMDMAAQTWTHNNGSGPLADPATTGITRCQIGRDAGGGTSSPTGHVGAVGLWRGRALGDSEIERLSSGCWERWSPDVVYDFSSGRDDPSRVRVDSGRMRYMQNNNATATQVTRADIASPPGFRKSPITRRR